MADFGALFRSTEEQVQPVEAQVTGNIPDWVKGSLLRVGPGNFDLPKEFVVNHWGDGYAVLFKFDIQNGKVNFSKRFLESDAYKRAVLVGRPVFTEFGTRAYPDPCKNVFSRMFSTLIPELTDNDSLNLFKIEDAIYAATETNFWRKINPETLETGEKVDLHKLVGVNLASSHVYQDDKGNAFTMGTSLVTGFKYHIIKIPMTKSKKAPDALKKSSIIATIPSRWKSCVSYYHSYGMSDRWIAFIEQPLLMNGMKLISTQVKGKAMKDCMEWCPEELNQFFVIDKSSGKVLKTKYKSEEAFFVFHHINTYEENGQIVVDIIGQDSPEVIDKMFLKNLRMSDFDLKDKAEARRFVLPIVENLQKLPEHQNLVTLDTKATAVRIGDTIYLRSDTITEPGYELPTINKAYLGKKYRYCYASGLYDKSRYRNSVVKIDMDTREVKTWYESNLTFPGEVQFMSRPGSTEEDDGLLLLGVTDLQTDSPDYLLVLDAKDLSEIARAEVKSHVPQVLHGLFL